MTCLSKTLITCTSAYVCEQRSNKYPLIVKNTVNALIKQRYFMIEDQ